MFRLQLPGSTSTRIVKEILSILKDLHVGLNEEFKLQLALLQGQDHDPAEIENMHSALVRALSAREIVRQLRQEFLSAGPGNAANTLRGLAAGVQQALQDEPLTNAQTREALIRTLYLLTRAEGRLSPYLVKSSIMKSSGPQSRVVINADLLYQAHHNLFPPERMLFGAVRPDGDRLIAGALFDVTGVGTSAHVRADPVKQSRALISMSASGTHLGIWIHSHPGSGVLATFPSQLDLDQHQDWIRDYSTKLVSATVVEDGFIRFWGTAVEAGQVEVQIDGPGVRKDQDEHVYQLTE